MSWDLLIRGGTIVVQSGQLSASIGAVKEMGVLTGHRIERSENGSPGDFDHLSDDQLRRSVIEGVVRLGLVPGLRSATERSPSDDDNYVVSFGRGADRGSF